VLRQEGDRCSGGKKQNILNSTFLPYYIDRLNNVLTQITCRAYRNALIDAIQNLDFETLQLLNIFKTAYSLRQYFFSFK
jgi:hypothetical protein